jgi:lactobin A/cerein 7B family class IIb bacteriocin
MKNLDVNELGFEELSQKEARTINGGWIWVVAVGLASIGAGIGIGYYVNS